MSADPLIVRPRGPLVAQRQHLLERLEEHRAKLRAAKARVHRALSWTPAAEVRRNPLLWVAGSLAVGFAIARITRRT